MKNIYKTFFLIIFNCASCIVHCAFAQTAPGIEWQNTIGGSYLDRLLSIAVTSDGGYIFSGDSYSNISGDKTENCIGGWDSWIVKTDSSGNIQWQNTIGGISHDGVNSISQTSDGGYICGGTSSSNISGDKTEDSNGENDFWILKLDSLGNIQWQNTIGGSKEEYFRSIKQTFDGGYICGGESYSGMSGDKTENNWDTTLFTPDYWVLKLDTMGNIQWQNTIGGNAGDFLSAITQTSDGGYICGGYSLSDISGDKTENSLSTGRDYWIIKLDVFGNIQWQNTIGGGNNDYLHSISQTSDGGYISGGHSESNISGDKTENCLGDDDYWIIKTNSLGNIQWQNTIGGNSRDELRSIQQTNDGGYILGGTSNSNISGDKTENCLGDDDYWIVKTDSLGNIQWQNTIGGSNRDYYRYITQTFDEGYICGGTSESNISGDKTENSMGGDDYWVVKLGHDTITGIADSPLERGKGCVIFPNPLITQSIITLSNPQKENFLFTLYDITGRVIEAVSTASEQIILTKGSKQPGVYLFKLSNEKTGERMNGKIVISN